MHSIIPDVVYIFLSPTPRAASELVFQTVCAHDTDLEVGRHQESFKNHCVARGLNACEFQSGLGMGSGRRSDDAPARGFGGSTPPLVEL